jgi:hypothetical protein
MGSLGRLPSPSEDKVLAMIPRGGDSFLHYPTDFFRHDFFEVVFDLSDSSGFEVHFPIWVLGWHRV